MYRTASIFDFHRGKQLVWSFFMLGFSLYFCCLFFSSDFHLAVDVVVFFLVLVVMVHVEAGEAVIVCRAWKESVNCEDKESAGGERTYRDCVLGGRRASCSYASRQVMNQTPRPCWPVCGTRRRKRYRQTECCCYCDRRRCC